MARNTITITVFFFIAAKLLAQSYTPFPQSATWNEVDIWQPGPTSITIRYYDYILVDEDTVIEQKTYQKIFRSDNQLTYVGGLRQTNDKRIYYYPMSDTTEHLLYQFGLEVGDTLTVHKSGQPTTILEIDSVFVGITYRKRYQVQSIQGIFGPEYWIEGIGSTKGLFFPYDGYEFENSFWVCTYQSNGISYQIGQPSAFNTYCTTSIDAIAIPASSEIFPNPTHDHLNISEAMLKDGYQIFDAFGVNCTKLVSQQAMGVLDIQTLKAGMYFLWSNGRYQRFLKM
jgi:hypothetical protein